MSDKLFTLTYSALKKIVRALIVLMGDLRCKGHGEKGYMQARVVNSLDLDVRAFKRFSEKEERLAEASHGCHL